MTVYINGEAQVGWTPTGNGGTLVANADIEAAAGIPLSKLVGTVCSEAEAAALIAAAIPTIVLKTIDEVVNNSAVLQDDDELFLPVGIDEVWDVFLILDVSSASGAPDMDIAFTVPVNGEFRWVTHDYVGNIGVNEVMTVLEAAEHKYNLANVQKTAIIWGKYIGGDTAGNLQLQWAQNGAVAEDTKVYAGSYLRAIKLN